METPSNKAWLVAVWPGMGAVAQIAGTYLVGKLGARPVAELDARPYYAPDSISVRAGLVQPARLPRSVLHAWRDPAGNRDLLVVLAERQPQADGLAYARALIELAGDRPIERVVTFAAMATPIHPAADPRVFAACTGADLLAELERGGATRLEEGEIGGLNGLFLAAAAERALPGACLLGEFPFFAASVPNPKASLAVLRIFARLADVAIDLGDLLAESRRVEQGMVGHLEAVERAATQAAGAATAEPVERFEGAEPVGPETVPPEVAERIEALFARAREDRSAALQLKAELDQRGLFQRYEDRFLDLFKQAG